MPFNPDEARGEHGRWTAGQRRLSRLGVNRRVIPYVGRVIERKQLPGLGELSENIHGVMMQAPTLFGQSRIIDNTARAVTRGMDETRLLEALLGNKLNPNRAYAGRLQLTSSGRPARRDLFVTTGYPKNTAAIAAHEAGHAADWGALKAGRMISSHPDFQRAFKADQASLIRAVTTDHPIGREISRAEDEGLEAMAEGRKGRALAPFYATTQPAEALAEIHRAATNRDFSAGDTLHRIRTAMPKTTSIGLKLLRMARILKGLEPETLEYLQKRRAGLAPRLGPARTPGMRMRRLGRSRLFLAKALLAKDMDAGDVHISSAIGNDQTRRRGRKYPNIAFARMPNVRKPVQLFGR